jgi:hypothetical protein
MWRDITSLIWFIQNCKVVGCEDVPIAAEEPSFAETIGSSFN